jgi:hypothetical protein
LASGTGPVVQLAEKPRVFSAWKRQCLVNWSPKLSFLK